MKGSQQEVEHLTEAALQLCSLVLHHHDFSLQHLNLALLAGYLEVQERAFVIDQFGDLSHCRFDQNLHD